MDTYTTSFTYPRRSRHATLQSSSFDFHQSDGFRSDSTFHNNSNGSETLISTQADADAVAKLVMVASSLHGCHITYFPSDFGTAWNFHISGQYQQVMIARGMILKECPVQVCDFFPSELPQSLRKEPYTPF
jgi:hypothetical protein